MASNAETDTWDAIYRSGRAQRTWPSEDVIRFCARRLRSGARVLEAGCGNGANLWFLVQQGYDVHGVDQSRVALDQAERLAAQHLATFGSVSLKLGQVDLGAIRAAYPYVTFDAVIDCRASQHAAWADHRAIYREYADLVKPGGWVFLLHLDYGTYPDRRAINQRPGDEWTWNNVARGVYADNGLVCMPPRHALTRLVAEAGFFLRRVETVQRITDETVCSHVAIDAQKIARGDPVTEKA